MYSGVGICWFPAVLDQRIEIIDVRDLAEWNVRLIEQNQVGIYNATGPDYALTMRHTLEVSQSVTGSGANFVYVPGEFMNEHETDPNSVNCWWLPENDPENRYFWEVDCRRAQAAGLTYRPLEATVQDTLAWANARPDDWKWRTGLTPDKESELLAAWRAKEML